MYSYRLSFRIEKDNDEHAFFGSGPAALLSRIEQTQSISKAAKDMHMAYSKALKIIRRAEASIGEPLICATTGGAGGGGSVLTQKAKDLLKAYQSCQESLNQRASELFDAHIKPIIGE